MKRQASAFWTVVDLRPAMGSAPIDSLGLRAVAAVIHCALTVSESAPNILLSGPSLARHDVGGLRLWVESQVERHHLEVHWGRYSAEVLGVQVKDAQWLSCAWPYVEDMLLSSGDAFDRGTMLALPVGRDEPSDCGRAAVLLQRHDDGLSLALHIDTPERWELMRQCLCAQGLRLIEENESSLLWI